MKPNEWQRDPCGNTWREWSVACTDHMPAILEALERYKDSDAALQQQIFNAHVQGLPANWVFTNTRTTLDLLVAECKTLRVELERVAGERDKLLAVVIATDWAIPVEGSRKDLLKKLHISDPHLFKTESACLHDRLNEDGVCRQCGADKRGIGE